MAGTSSEAGDTLVEVIISAMLVGLIVVATLQGFDVVNRTSESQRVHNEAAVLAAQSQENLRSLPASSLILLKASPHVYAQTVGGTVYTITQSAALLPAGKSSASCSVTESKRQSGNAFSITSTVSWPIRKPENGPLTASSIITPPTGSALEVDAGNAPVVTSGVGNIPIIVNYTPAYGGGEVTQEQTTPAEGCVVFGGIPATSALVEVGEVAGYVTRWGASKFPTKEVDLAPNYTTHYEVLYNQGAAIKAEFAYKGSKTFKHYNNEGTVEESQPVTGDTFVTFNSRWTRPPTTAWAAPATRRDHRLQPAAEHLRSVGHLARQPLPLPRKRKNQLGRVPGRLRRKRPRNGHQRRRAAAPKVFLTPGGTTTVTVPTSYDPLNLYKGSLKEVVRLPIETGFRWKNLETTNARAVTVTNSECAGAAGDDDSAVTGKHTQVTTTGRVPSAGTSPTPSSPSAANSNCASTRAPTPTRASSKTTPNRPPKSRSTSDSARPRPPRPRPRRNWPKRRKKRPKPIGKRPKRAKQDTNAKAKRSQKAPKKKAEEKKKKRHERETLE